MSKQYQPRWLNESCPGWCAGEHCEGDHVDDRRHQSEMTTVPVMVHTTRWEQGSSDPIRMTGCEELTVVAFRYIDSTETWIAVASDTQHLELSVGSARRLFAAVQLLLARVV